MRDIFISEAKKYSQDIQAHILREKLQKAILNTIDKKNFFSLIHFLGGTALRLLYDIKRFSEDLDFSLDPSQQDKFNFKSLIHAIQNDLNDYMLPTELKLKSEGAVQTCLFKFPKLLRELSSRYKGNEKLSIRLDIDTNPPLGFHTETSSIPSDFMILIKHYDKPSLFAGKLHALISRPYLKGRDVYDFIWYCTNKIPVNLNLLNNAYRQTHKKDPPWTPKTLPDFMVKKIGEINLDKALKDAAPFMQDLSEKRFFNRELLMKMAREIKVE